MTRWKNILKAYPFEEKRLAKWTPPYIVQPKYDGDRCKAIPTPNGYLLVSSEGNPFFSVPHINAYLDKHFSGSNLIFDGELYNHEICVEGGHEAIHSIVSRQVNIHPDHRRMEFHTFDLELPTDQLSRILKLMNLKLKFPVIQSPFWVCDNLDSIKKVYDNLLMQGYEGIIVRHSMCQYEYKRSTHMMKFKPKRSDIYKVVGYKEEVTIDGTPKNTLGSLELSSQSGERFSVSAGLNVDERYNLWKIKEQLIGKDAMVYYQHLTNKQVPKGCFDIKILG